MSSKMFFVIWRGVCLEVNGVLRKVCDNVLYEKGIDNKILFYCVCVFVFFGVIYKSV